jgi:Rab family protein
MQDRAPLKLVLLGDSGTGKTSLITRYVTDSFAGDARATLAASTHALKFDHGGQTVELVVWDTAGQEKYRGLAPMYYRGAVAAIIVFDLTRHDSFEQVSGWINELVTNIGTITIAVCANKTDRLEERVISSVEGRTLASSAKVQYYETSAMTGQGVRLLFQGIITRLFETRPELLRPTVVQAPVVEKSLAGTDGCC